MEPVRIRACPPNDIDAVLQLDRPWEEEQIAHNFTPISREEFLASLKRFPAYFLVAESGGGLVGYIQGAVRLRKWVAVIPEEEPYVEIENVYVQPSFRHRRIGGQLMERLMAVAAHHGIQRFVVSSTSKEMDKMLHFSRRHGFTPWYVQRFKEMKRPVSYTRSAREHTVAAIAYSRHWALASRCSELPALL